MKRLIGLLVALMLLAPAALAEGNRLLPMDNSDYVQSMFADGQTLYLVSDARLYTWREGEEAMTAWDADELRLPREDGGEDYVGLYDFRLYADADGLHGVRVGYDQDYQPESLRLYDMTLADGAVSAVEAAKLNLPDALRSSFYPDAACVRDGLLYLLGNNDNGYTLAVIDLTEPRKAGTTELSSYDCHLLPGPDGVLVAYGDYMDGESRLIISRIEDDASLTEVVCATGAQEQGAAVNAETGAVYAVLDGRVCPIDLATGEAGEPIGALPVQTYHAAMLGKKYAAMLSGGVAVMDTDGRLDENSILKVEGGYYYDWLNKAAVAFSVEHPELTPVLGNGGYNMLDELMTQTPDTDIYVTGGFDGGSYEAVLSRGYMAPLDGSEKLKAFAERVYPNLLKKLTHGGELVAVPVGLDGSGMGMSTSLMEKMGINADDVPHDWPGFLDFLEDTVKPNLGLLGEKDSFTYDGMYAQDFRQFLSQRVLNDFEQASSAADVLPNYEDPRLVATLERLEQIDFSEYGLPDKPEGEDGMGYGMSGDTHYLIQFDANYMFGDYMMTDCQPMPMGFGDDLPGVLSVQLSAAFVNPYSRHREQAVTFLESLVDRMPQELAYALCPDLTEPVRRADADEEQAWYERQIETWQRNVDEADPADKQMMQEAMANFISGYEDYKQNQAWLISEEKLAWYRANAENLAVATPSWFNKDTTGEAWQLMEQYSAGQLSAREFLAAVNRKARMMAMEEG